LATSKGCHCFFSFRYIITSATKWYIDWTTRSYYRCYA
jgi:hypothetical protein